MKNFFLLMIDLLINENFAWDFLETGLALIKILSRAQVRPEPGLNLKMNIHLHWIVFLWLSHFVVKPIDKKSKFMNDMRFRLK